MGYRAVSQHFGACIAHQDYEGAWQLLTQEAQRSITAEGLKAAATAMIAYAPGPFQGAEVMEEFILEDWPDKQPGDLAVVYVALTGESFSEAVNLTLVQTGFDILIRHLEWGRP